jgi:hypothetical protein
MATPFQQMENQDFTAPTNEIINELDVLPDGSKVFEIIDEKAEKEGRINFDFYRNLAEDLSQSALSGLGENLLQEIEDDLRSRQQWEKTLSTGIKYLGFTVEEFRSIPFMHACSAYDTTLSSALYSAWATIRAELLPASGPVDAIVLGEENDELATKANKLKKMLNNYLTVIDKSYYPDCDVHYLYTAFMGNGFKKIWQDPILCRPMSRTIAPEDIIIDNNCVDVLSSNRISHRIKLTRQEILLKQDMGEFIDVDLRDVNDVMSENNNLNKAIDRIDGVSKDQVDNKNLFEYYETSVIRHIDGIKENDLPDDNFPVPYIVTIDIQNRKVVKIIRNWNQDDNKFKRKEKYTHSKYLPGFGLYGYGILQLLGSNSVALTQILRQAVDAGTFANFPAFLKMKGLKMEQNDKMIGPGEAHDIETGGAVRIQDAIMPLPYKGADPTLMALRQQLREESKQPAGVAETQISDKHTDAAVGTILALMEKATIIQSSVMRCLHHTLSQELQIIYETFKDHMGDEPYTFKTKGETVTISLEDFDDDIRIVPVSDADLDTNTQRTMKAYGQLQIAEKFPQLHDIRKVLYRLYTSLNVQDIDEILIPEKEVKPLDPISTVMNIMQGKPVKAALWQDHRSYIAIISTSPVADSPQGKAIIQEHASYQYLIEMQQTMGIELPSLEQMIDNPELQNKIAIMATGAAQALAQQRQSQQEPTPQQVLMLDIEQRDRAATLKNEETKMKVEAESAKAGLQFQTEMEKLRIQQEMAEEKNEKDLEIARLKEDHNVGNTLLKGIIANKGKDSKHERS